LALNAVQHLAILAAHRLGYKGETLQRGANCWPSRRGAQVLRGTSCSSTAFLIVPSPRGYEFSEIRDAGQRRHQNAL